MGLIKAASGATGGVLADQWKEFFVCDALPAEVLAIRGEKRVSGRSANRHGGDNIISDGSVIAGLNRARCFAREAELAAVEAFSDREGNLIREDIPKALNRMSSMLYLLMIQEKAKLR